MGIRILSCFFVSTALIFLKHLISSCVLAGNLLSSRNSTHETYHFTSIQPIPSHSHRYPYSAFFVIGCLLFGACCRLLFSEKTQAHRYIQCISLGWGNKAVSVLLHVHGADILPVDYSVFFSLNELLISLLYVLEQEFCSAR